MTRRQWTFPELYDAARAIESGRTWDEVGADYGVSGSTVRTLLGRHRVEYDMSKRPPKEHPDEDKIVAAIAHRNRDGVSWSIAAERVGWTKSTQALRVAALRSCKRHGGAVAAGMPGVRRSRWA